MSACCSITNVLGRVCWLMWPLERIGITCWKVRRRSGEPYICAQLQDAISVRFHKRKADDKCCTFRHVCAVLKYPSSIARLASRDQTGEQDDGQAFGGESGALGMYRWAVE